MNLKIASVVFFVAGLIGSATASEKNKELKEIQKLEKAVQQDLKKGVCSLDDSIKAKLLENRAQYIAGNLSKKEWLDKERELNSELLAAQNARFAS